MKRLVQKRNLINSYTWKNILTLEEINTINDAWRRFQREDLLLSESPHNSSRLQRWERFLIAEDDASGDKKKTGIWSKIKSGISKGLKWIGRKAAGKRSLEKGGSLFGLGQKSKKQQEEWGKLEQDQKELIDLLKSSTSKDYPNNEDVEEFKLETMAALRSADSFIKSHEDPAVRVEMYEVIKKWVSYLLDQKLGDYYKHFMENMSLAGAMLLLEAEEDALGVKKGSSESIKGLESKILPTVLKILGGAGLTFSGAIIAAYPEILTPSTIKAVTIDDSVAVQQNVDKVVPTFNVTGQYGPDFTKSYFDGLQAQGISFSGDPTNNSTDLIKFFSDRGGGDPSVGAAAWFKELNVANPKGTNSSYFLDRLNKGMPVTEAWEAKGKPGLYLERMGGGAGIPVSVGGWIAKSLVNKAVKGLITKFVVTSGVLGATGALTAAAAGGVAGVGGLLSGFAISRLREKSKKDSRAAFLNDLYDQIDQFEKKEETILEPASTEPPSKEDNEKGEEAKEVEKLGPAELAMIVDNVMKDLGTYMDEIDANYNPEVSKDKVEQLVKLLNDKGKLKFSEYNRDDKTISDIMTKAGKEQSKVKQDDVFLKNIPPAYKAIPTQWKRKQPELSADISDILGDKILPMHMLALRRALTESLFKLIFKHARVLHENKQRDNLIIERWSKLAGV